MSANATRLIVVAAILAATAALSVTHSTHAQVPEVVAAYPPEGYILYELPKLFQVCLRHPAEGEEIGDVIEYEFGIVSPDNTQLPYSLEFDQNGSRVLIHPQSSQPVPDGQWRFEWALRNTEDGQSTVGGVTFSIARDQRFAGITGGLRCDAPKLPAAADDDGPDVLLMALLTVGVAGGAAVLGLMGYVIRNRVGFWLHRPPPREGGAPEEHH